MLLAQAHPDDHIDVGAVSSLDGAEFNLRTLRDGDVEANVDGFARWRLATGVDSPLTIVEARRTPLPVGQNYAEEYHNAG